MQRLHTNDTTSSTTMPRFFARTASAMSPASRSPRPTTMSETKSTVPLYTAGAAATPQIVVFFGL